SSSAIARIRKFTNSNHKFTRSRNPSPCDPIFFKQLRLALVLHLSASLKPPRAVRVPCTSQTKGVRIMYRRALISLIACATLLASLIIVFHAVAAQPTTPPGQAKKLPSSPPDYNPYPAGILPADLDSEIARVLSEI